VDDARQDVFMVVHRRVDEYEQLDVVRPWLFTISRLVANNYRRGVRRRDALHRLFVTTLAPPDAEEPGARQEAEQFLRRFLDTLSESQRLVFYLADIEGLTAPQIAASLGSNPNTVSSRIRKARQQFAAVLAAYRANRWRWRPRRWLRELASAELLE
jgi:RNA polymerase sigma-70 factor (ECF subfamily)